MTSKTDKINELIESIKEVRKKGSLYEEERANISSKARGFIRAISGEQREGNYMNFINRGRKNFISDKAFFDTKCKLMIQFLTILKEEIDAREAFQNIEEPSFNKGIVAF